MPLRTERSSIEPYKQRKERLRRELNLSAEQAVREGERRRAPREAEEREIEALRAEAGALDLDVAEVPARVSVREGSMFTRGLSGKERRTREGATLREAVTTGRRDRGIEEAFEIEGRQAEIKRQRKDLADEQKDLEQQQEDEDFMMRFLKPRIGQTFNKGTVNQYILDTPEEAIHRFKQVFRRAPSRALSDAILRMPWPARGVDEVTGRVKPAKAKKVSASERKIIGMIRKLKSAGAEIKEIRQAIEFEGEDVKKFLDEFRGYKQIGGVRR